MHKEVRSILFRKLRNGAASHGGAVPQEIEIVSIFHAWTVAVSQSQRSRSCVACNGRPLQHILTMVCKGKMMKFEIDSDIEGLPIQI